MKNLKYLLISILLVFSSHTATAENSRDLGKYIVHYNAISTTSLSTKVAKSYGIRRSKNRGILNVAVMKKQKNDTTTSVPAMVTAHATNLNSQIKALEMREIKEQSAIYYIAEFNINDEESLNFTINISPENGALQTIRFDKQFFAD